MIHAFLYGLLLSFGLIIPLGVQNVFVFNQGAAQSSFIKAIPSVITAAICDTLLILVSVLGLSIIVLEFSWLKQIIFVIGFCFLMYMGWVIWNTIPHRGNHITPDSSKRQIIFAASVSLLNPHALIDTISVIGTNSLYFIGKERIAYTAACIMISWLWFFSLCAAGHFLSRKTQSNFILSVINKISALIIWGVAIYMLIQLWDSF